MICLKLTLLFTILGSIQCQSVQGLGSGTSSSAIANAFANAAANSLYSAGYLGSFSTAVLQSAPGSLNSANDDNCLDETKPVCSVTKDNVCGRGRKLQTFQNECKLNVHNRQFGNELKKLYDGPCRGR